MSRDWDPELYRRYEDERTRPARDLLARVALAEAAYVVDLGCGPGNSTELLVERFPGASVLGTDTSAAMLDSARERLPQCRFELSDITAWQPATPPDLIFANAVLHWIPDHDSLFPRLLSMLAAGGVLAVQMPDNLDEATHRLMREVAAESAWASRIGDAGSYRSRILSADHYYDLLAPNAERVEIWRTAYQHPMASAAAIVDWLRATGLRPFLDPLSGEQRTAFLAEYERRIDEAYAPRADGKRLLAFPRTFVVVQR
jgi:trans-aconitate 2-methyltransferase